MQLRDMRFVFFGLVFIFFGQSATAQLNVKQYRVEDGLPQMQVSSIQEDSLGNLWVGTLGGGISRFDGSTFKIYSTDDGLPSVFVRGILIHKKKVYVSTFSGISVFDGKSFTNFLTDNHAAGTNTMFVRKDTLFVLETDFSLSYVANNKLEQRAEHHLFTDLLFVQKVENNSTVLFQNPKEGKRVVILSKDSTVIIPVESKFSRMLSAFVSESILYLATDQGLFSVTDGRLNFVLAPVHEYVGFETKSKSFIASETRQLISLSKRGENPETILSEVDPLCYITDSQGNFWFGTNTGLYEIYSSPFQKFPESKSNTLLQSTDMTLSIVKKDNDFFIGASGSVSRISKNGKVIHRLPVAGFVHALRKDREGRIWVCTTTGIGVLNTTTNKIEWRSTTQEYSFLSVAFDKSNNGIAASTNGIYEVPKEGKATLLDSSLSKFVWAVRFNDADDKFYIAAQNGLYTCSDRVINRVLQSDTDFSSIEFLPDGRIILGSFGRGVGILTVDKKLTWIGREQGLSSNTIFFVTQFNGSAWAGTEKGIDQIRFQNNGFQIFHYGVREGLPGLETNLNAYLASDTLWVGLVSGMFRLDHELKPAQAPLHIDQIEISDSAGKKQVLEFINGHPPTISLNPGQNYIKVKFNKIDRSMANHYQYKYFLDGFDEIWSEGGSDREAVFNKLPPGSYVLRVRATDRAGQTIYDEIQLAITLQPKFYQTNLFKAGIILIVIALAVSLVYAYNQFRINQELRVVAAREDEKAKLRKDISRDFHDELGNQVARMINYVGLLRINRVLENETYEMLNGYSQRILNGAKDFVWALDPLNDELTSVVIHLKDFGEQMLNEKKIELRFDGDLETKTAFPIGYGRQINLIFKEALTNVFKHSKATQVNLGAVANGKSIIIYLKDNGVGITESTVTTSERGLSNMFLRAKRINAVLEIVPEDPGTLVRLRINL
jgi:signal transduction histidine kinase/ligand-binding sensor domain-containing protein